MQKLRITVRASTTWVPQTGARLFFPAVSSDSRRSYDFAFRHCLFYRLRLARKISAHTYSGDVGRYRQPLLSTEFHGPMNLGPENQQLNNRFKANNLNQLVFFLCLNNQPTHYLTFTNRSRLPTNNPRLTAKNSFLSGL
jgi:hypothetical protein